ncbi:MAG: hypothetical protein VW169_02900 [Rhodospirillaceae bacterium]
MAKLDTSKLERHEVEVRGRAEPIVVYVAGNVDGDVQKERSGLAI